jgi:lipopolysaccharide export system protein LptA
MRVLADRIVVRRDAEGFQHAEAFGKPVRFRQRQDPRPAEKEGIWMDGEALRIEIDEKDATIKLFENARVDRGSDRVSGNYILVDQTSQFFSVTAGKDGEQRVRVTIQPNPPAEAKPPAEKK